jgi:uncharacterized protein DUF6600
MRTRLLAGVFSALFVAGAPVAGLTVTPAHAQASISVEFRTALQDHGRWQRHSRWGEVWVPGNLARDWRPYTNGHWVYTDDWGWYWVEADAEASWGWVTNHYGRWVYDDEMQWAWVPGEEWGPAWVEWRRSNDNDVVGWAALAPDEVIADYRESPRYWVFVRSRDFVSPRIASVIVTEREYPVFFRQTVVVNRTVVVRDRGPRFAVNPGIPAAYIAASVGRPLRAYEVQPRVLASTAGIRGAVVVREQDLRRGQGFRPQVTVRETRTEIRPERNVSAPRALGAGEQGRLGDNPPRAARAEQGPTDGRNRDDRQGAGDRNRNANERQGPQDRNRNANERQGAEDRNRNANERQGTEDRNRNANERQGPQDRNRNANERQGTTGQSRGEQKQQGAEDRNRNEPKQRPSTEGRGDPRQQGPQERNRGEQKQGAEGRNRGPERQPQGTEGRSNESRQRPGTDGIGSRDQRSNVQPRGPETRQQPAPQTRQQQPAPQQGRAQPQQQQPQQQPRNVDRGGGDPRGARAESPRPAGPGAQQPQGAQQRQGGQQPQGGQPRQGGQQRQER